MYENKRLLDENDAVVQPIEVYFEEKETNFVSVKEGTTQFVDFDSDGKLDIIFSGQSEDGDIFTSYKNTGNNNFAAVDLSLPPVRDGKFTFGDLLVPRIVILMFLLFEDWKNLGYHSAEEILNNGGNELMKTIKEKLMSILKFVLKDSKVS